MKEFGFLRETTELAIKSGLDTNTGIIRTGLNEYLEVIFPNINDWIHNKQIGKLQDGSICRNRPDYRSESLKLVIEFDGLQHYQSPSKILKDYENTKIYKSLGYNVVRIPYFIQLTNKAVKTLFNVDVDIKLFDNKYQSLGFENAPAILCPAGITRMANEFKLFPEQYYVNLKYLKSLNNDFLTGVSLLEKEFNKI